MPTPTIPKSVVNQLWEDYTRADPDGRSMAYHDGVKHWMSKGAFEAALIELLEKVQSGEVKIHDCR